MCASEPLRPTLACDYPSRSASVWRRDHARGQSRSNTLPFSIPGKLARCISENTPFPFRASRRREFGRCISKSLLPPVHCRALLDIGGYECRALHHSAGGVKILAPQGVLHSWCREYSTLKARGLRQITALARVALERHVRDGSRNLDSCSGARTSGCRHEKRGLQASRSTSLARAFPPLPSLQYRCGIESMTRF